jgi:hypothetical protein
MVPSKRQGLVFSFDELSGFEKLLEQKERNSYIQTLISIENKN